MTLQILDTVTYNGEDFCTYNEPFKKYNDTLDYKHRLRFYPPHTALWKGYVGRWSIKNDHLYLINFIGHINDKGEVGLDYIFPKQKEVFAEWFTGSLILVTADQLLNHYNVGNEFSQDEIYLEFDKGILQSSYIVNSKILEKIFMLEAMLEDEKIKRKYWYRSTTLYYIFRNFFHKWISFAD